MNPTRRLKIAALALIIFAISIQTGNAQWVHTNGPDNLTLALLATGSGIFAGTDSGVYVTVDNGISWAPVTSDIAHRRVFSLVEYGSNILAGTDSGVYMTADSGTSWAPVRSGISNREVFSMAKNGNNIFAGTDSGVFVSTNDEIKWSYGSSHVNDKVYSLTNLVYSLAVSGGGSIFAGTHSIGLFRSTDNGASWTAVDSGLPIDEFWTLAVSGDNIYAGTWGSGIFRSTNNGTSWTRTISGLTDWTVQSLVVSGDTIFAGTWRNGVCLSADSASHWTEINSGLTDLEVRSLAVNKGYIFAGTGNSGVWRRPLSDFTTTIDSPVRLVSNPNAFKIFLPGTGSTASIVFSLTRREQVTIAVYSLSGHAILSLTDERFEPGLHTLLWDTKAMGPGCYMIKMRTRIGTYAKSLVLMR